MSSDPIYDPSAIANFFLDSADEDGVHITQMKLQKLVYIGYGWVSALLDRKLFEEPFQAWQHGPVVESLYHEFKHFRAEPISSRSGNFDLDSGEFTESRIRPDDESILVVLGRVWDVYSHFSAAALRDKTHEAGTPWSNAWKNGVRNQTLKDADISPHFLTKIKGYLSEPVQQS